MTHADLPASPSSPATASARRSPPRPSRSSSRWRPAGVKFEPTRYDLGAERYLATGEVLPDSVLDEIRQHDAILLGAVGGRPGDPNLPPGILERGLLLRLRFELDHYVNLRPSRIFPGVAVAAGATPARSTSWSSARAPRAPTPATAARCASARPPRSPPRSASTPRSAWSGSSATPSPGRSSGRARSSRWCTRPTCSCTPARCGRGSSTRSAEEFPDVTVDYLHVDAATIFLATDPARFDVIVTDNLFGDIITDLAAAITGGIGLAASGNINPDRTAPSMFEPVHGSAPDIAGQQKADPTAAILSAALLLDHLGLDEAARARRGGGDRRPRRARARRHAPYRRDRRRDRRARSRLTRQPAATPDRYRARHGQLARSIAVDRRPTSPVDDDRLAEILANPGFGLHFTDHMFIAEWTPERGLARRPRHAVRPALARPGDRGPALRAGDLRGA